MFLEALGALPRLGVAPETLAAALGGVIYVLVT
jgi:hypothetical protein